MRHPLFALTLLFAATSLAAQRAPAPWQMETSGTTANLRGIHAVGGGVAWASGASGTVLRTEDSGYMWQSCAMPPGAEKLDFRAIWAWDANTAIVMSSGTGDKSRLYRTTDGCSHWTLVFTNPEPGGFYDGLVFLDKQRGLLIGDATRSRTEAAPANGGSYALRIRATVDGGATWAPVTSADSPPTPGTELYAFPEEGFFAASNSSLAAQAGMLWLGTNQGRVLRRAPATRDFDAATCASTIDPAKCCAVVWTGWQSIKTPLAGSAPTAGIFSLVFKDAQAGIAVGGDYAKPGEREGTAAYSRDGGAHWALSSAPPHGYRSAVAWDPDHRLWITVGPNGSDFSRDDGKTWQAIEHAPNELAPPGEWNALSLPWVVGPNGRVAKLNAEALPPAVRRAQPGPGAQAGNPQ